MSLETFVEKDSLERELEIFVERERERERESLEILFKLLRFNFYVVFGCQESLIEIEKVTKKDLNL